MIKVRAKASRDHTLDDLQLPRIRSVFRSAANLKKLIAKLVNRESVGITILDYLRDPITIITCFPH